MKKLILVLAILLVASPVWAVLDVNIVKVDSDTVAIKYTGADTANLPRAFALTVTINGTGTLDTVDTFKTGESTASSRGFGIYPARITINSDGTVSPGNYGNPLADEGSVGTTDQALPSQAIVLEFGSLYYADANAPATSGTLCQINFTKGTATQITLGTETTYRGGIVLEDGTQTADTFTFSIIPDECMKSTAAGYAVWVDFGKPACWCYQRQCRGDADGLKQGAFWVSGNDLTLFRAGFNKSDSALKLVTNGICGDFDRAKQGAFRVSGNDLTLFRLYFNKTTVAVCDMTDYNFWVTP